MTRLAASRWRAARWLVLVPHPDDETIGAGALIAETAAGRRLAAVAYLTDGTGSHPHGGARLAAARRQEARLALHRLGAGRVRPLHLDWRDAHPAPPGSRAHVLATGRLAALIRARAVDAIAVTAAHEPHCDHAAAHDLARAAARASRRRPAVFEYLVWGAPIASSRRFATAPLAPGRRRAALAAHRSQTGPRFGEGFRLPPRAIPAADTLHLRRHAG